MTGVVDRHDNAGSTLSPAGRSSRILVDLEAIAANVRYFRDLVSPRVSVMAVVKADGYGHGAPAVAAEAVAAGATHLAVATVSEGIELRTAGQSAPILILGPIDPSEVGSAVEHDLALTLADRRFAALVGRIAAAHGRRGFPIHLKVDTGMHRFGAAPEDVLELARAVAGTGSLAIEGVFTHFADADGTDEQPTRQQAAVFEAVLGSLTLEGILPPLVHAANSAATLRWRRYDYDLVRVGIALYGLPPAPGFVLPDEVRPALRVVSRVARVSRLRPGDGVSYGFAYRATGDELAALVPIGYADGYPRALSNRGWMSVRGRRAPVRGRVCMDQVVVGLPAGSEVRLGDEVGVMGGEGPSLDEIARTTGTIAYEIATGLTRRMPRTYVRGTAADR